MTGLEHTTAMEAAERAAQEVVRSLVVGLDPNGLVSLWNDEAASLTGLGATEVVGRPLPESVAGRRAQRARLDAAVDAVRKDALAHAEELVLPLVSRDGQPRLVRWRVRALELEAQEAIVLLAGVDITQAAEAGARAAEAEALAAMGRLTRALAHAFKNPLNVGVLELERLRRVAARLSPGPNRDAILARARSIGDQLTRLTRLLDDFLALARPERLDRALVDLTAVVEQAVELHREETDELGVRIDLCVRGPLGPAFADASRMRLALMSLISNAIDAVRGHPEAQIWVLATTDDDGMIALRVQDSGPGIGEDPDALAQPFHSTKPGRAGLGLPLVAQIAKMHGGTLRIGPRAGGGTEASLTVPLHADEESS